MPILAADGGMVLAGHGRLAAGKMLDMAEVPVIAARRVEPEARLDLLHLFCQCHGKGAGGYPSRARGF